MKKTVKAAAYMCALMMSVSSVTVLSASAAENSGSYIQADADTAESGNIKTGTVTSVSGNKITLALGMSVHGKPGENNGQSVPGKPPADGSASENAVPPEKPSGSGSENAPADHTPPGNSSAAEGFPAGGETITITVSDESIIKKNGSSASLSDIKEGTMLRLVYDDNGALTEINILSGQGGGQGAPGGGSPEKSSLDLTAKITADGTSKTYKSKKITQASQDSSVVLAKNGGKITLNKCSLIKSGDSTNVDDSNFYALNAAAAVQSGSTLTINGGRITTSSEGSNAVFATGENAKATISNAVITTSGNSSRGLDATYGGTVIGSDLTIKTTGAHCAPLATDRGGGTIKATSSKLYASGDGSPCIYSTGDITAVSCTGKATGSQIAVVEGKNSIKLTKCTLTGAGKNGVMLYQSTSGDAAVGTAVFTSQSSTLKTTSDGPMFYITNTDAKINLKNNKLVFGSGILINAAGNNTNNWGTPGSNGGNVTLTADTQELAGDVLCDEISSVTLKLTKNSTFTGAADNADTGDVAVTLDKTSVWNVTADSYVTYITDSDTSLSNIVSNGHTIYYSKENSKNAWLGGKTVTLSDGGKLVPVD